MKLHRVLVAVSVLLLVSVAAFAQLTTGNLTGTVTTAGAPLPGVTVSLAAKTLQGTRTSVTDSNGAYNFQGLPPGDYTVTFTLEGLQTVTRNVKVGVSETSRTDADMKVSTVTESITVTASAPAVLETQQVQTNITSHLVENLPMGRTLVATTNLAPNVTPTGPNGGLIIAGGQSYDSTYYVDGAVVNEVLRGQP
ncbi:MAG TPA: carboxypeptidase-like regulatory domain-containing protein, partial [Thermoanaerobaculia bacterium]